jgi:hypothetical protein
MAFRLLEYVLRILRQQMRHWQKKHRSLTRFRFQPVVAVVFYTGTERWESVGQLSDMVERADLFGPFIPSITPPVRESPGNVENGPGV